VRIETQLDLPPVTEPLDQLRRVGAKPTGGGAVQWWLYDACRPHPTQPHLPAPSPSVTHPRAPALCRLRLPADGGADLMSQFQALDFVRHTSRVQALWQSALYQ